MLIRKHLATTCYTDSDETMLHHAKRPRYDATTAVSMTSDISSQEMHLECYDPSYDIIFKELFGCEKNKQFLIHLINDTMEWEGTSKIQEILFLNTDITQDVPGEKGIRYDIRATTIDGRQFIIEMQRSKQAFYEKRVVFYASRAYILQLEEPNKQGKANERHIKSYKDISPVIVISILDHTLFEETKAFLSHYSSRERETQRQLHGSPEFVFLELEKFVLYNAHYKNKDISHMSGVEKWAYLLKEASHMHVLPSNFANTVYGKALQSINKSTLTPAQREAFDKSILDQQSREIEKQELEDKFRLANERVRQETIARQDADQRAQQANERAQQEIIARQQANERAQQAEAKNAALIALLKQSGISESQLSQWK